MNSNVIGIICAVAVVVCGLGCYFIGRTQGMELAIQNLDVNVTLEEKEDDHADDSLPGEPGVLREDHTID